MEEIRVVQEKLLEMAKVFHNFCVENDIKYYMCGGTMLGAIRHSGFIPWDDDMDFFVMRDDYEKLISLKYKLDKNYTFNVHSLDKKYKYGFCKMYDERTTYIEVSQDTKFVGGVFIDIFPLDNIGDDAEKARKTQLKIYRRRRIISGIYQRGKRTTLIKTVLTGIFQLLPKTQKWFDWPYKAIRKYRDKDTVYVTNVYGSEKGRGVLPVESFGKPTLYNFEDTQLYGLENYDTYLKISYGDYMTPPPPEKRVSHSIGYMDFNMPYKQYIEEHKKEKK